MKEMCWPPGFGRHASSEVPPPNQGPQIQSKSFSTSKATFHELKSVSLEETDSVEDADYLDYHAKRNSFDLSVLIGDAHSLIRFSVYSRVPSESEDLATAPLSDSSSSQSSEDEHLADGKTEVKSGEKSSVDKESKFEDVGVKIKLPPKISNMPKHQTTVILEYSDTD